MTDFLQLADLPPGLEYPSPELVRVVELGLLDFEPWHILRRESLRQRFLGMAARYPDEGYIPFAARQDNDDVACWSVSTGEGVLVVHDFATQGHEVLLQLAGFNEWLRLALEDFIDFGA